MSNETDLLSVIIVTIVVSAIVSAIVSKIYPLIMDGIDRMRLEREEAVGYSDAPVFTELVPTEPWPTVWLTVRCEICDHEVVFDDPIEPGQAAVVRCNQCNTAWAAVLDPVYVVKADGLELKQEQLISG